MGTEKKTTKEINALQNILYNLIADKKLEGISQNKIANEIGISASQLTKYIDGMEIGLNSLVKIADYFNCSLDYLIGRAKEKTTNEDIKIAVATTGLSEKAINILNQNSNCNISTIISKIIENENIHKVSNDIATLAIHCSSLRLGVKGIDDIQLAFTPVSEKVKRYGEVISNEDYTDLLLFKAQNSMLDVIKDISKCNKAGEQE